MTFISYAQNYEDVMLWRALRHVPRGFYIDVGAFSPDADSVTRAFYERGWTGINIEPNPGVLEQLTLRRTHDINLGVAASDHAGEAVLHVIEDTGLTTVESDVARSHETEGWAHRRVTVPTMTLEEVWSTHVPEGQNVHFVKIDVEGHEQAVIAGLDWRRRRPWIVVVEATIPRRQDTAHESWEPLLVEANYEPVYWDGLNRFYLAAEHAHLRETFSSPPNVFDNFVTAALADARAEIESLRAQGRNGAARELREEIAALRDMVQTLVREEGESKALLHRLAERERAPGARYLSERPLWERLLFRETGKPKRPLRRLLFHTNGKPRGMFRNLVLHKDGRPHAPFRKWMASPQYRALPRALHVAGLSAADNASLSPNEAYFMERLKATRGASGET